MTSDVCQGCGAPMEEGQIVGMWPGLGRIVRDEKVPMTVAGWKDKLAKGGFWRGPSMPAGRCTRCRIGTFSY